jgi:TolB-like protein
LATTDTVAAEEHLPLPDKPSIVVLPFDNMSADPEQDYFADGITEDIITELSRFRGLFVIARNTAFTYKGEKIDVPKVAAELGVHFVLEGSVRKAGDRVRVSAQLIDGGTGSHVWAERYDSKLEDVFDLQEEVTRQVVASVEPQIGRAELAHMAGGERRFDEAHDLGWRSYAEFGQALRTSDQRQLDEAIELARRALALNEKCGIAYEMLVTAYTIQSHFLWGDDPMGAPDRALERAEAAWSELPDTESAFRCLGLARLYKGYPEQAVRDFQRALEINPNNADTLTHLASCEATLGDTKAAREHAALALRLRVRPRSS